MENAVDIQTIESVFPKIDVEMDLLQVKSGIAKEIISRDLVLGGADHNFRRHSLHYSHKRIKRPTTSHTMPKILLGKSCVNVQTSYKGSRRSEESENSKNDLTATSTTQG